LAKELVWFGKQALGRDSQPTEGRIQTDHLGFHDLGVKRLHVRLGQRPAVQFAGLVPLL
jgi:hypothetical protein